MKITNYILILFMGMILFNCAKTKKFQISSNPDKALIMSHEKEKLKESTFINYGQETPGNENVLFWGKEKEQFITVEKRGFKKSTQRVTPESNEVINFNLEPINGISQKVFEEKDLLTGKFALLPPNIEVTIHSGIGRLDKRKKSPEISQRVSKEFLFKFNKVLKNNNQIIRLNYEDQNFLKLWAEMSPEIRKNIQKINIKRLKYYGSPPFIKTNINKLLLDNEITISPDYFLYVLGKCTSETKGRKIGNIFMSILGAAHSGAMQGAYGITTSHDPSAFYPDSGTMILFYVIDAKSSEILHIIPVFSGLDITKEKKIDKLISRISTFPNINKKKKK